MGIIEDGEPPQGGVHQTHIDAPVPQSGADISKWILQTLRNFEGDPLAVLAQVADALRADEQPTIDPRGGLEFPSQDNLDNALPRCDCGTPLVSRAFIGRATIRCEVCGNRWGVDVEGPHFYEAWAL